MKIWGALLATGLSLLLLPASAVAQNFPDHPIRLIVPFPAGGPNDIIARVIGQRMQELLKQPVLIDNRGGQGGVLGTDALAKAKEYRPDLIILDLGMPVMNGLETARELKRVMPVVPIILFTLHGEMISDEQASGSGVDLVVAKNDISKLSEHVRSLLLPN